MKRIIFWDWNGTLFDDLKLSLDILNALLEEFDYPQRFTTESYRDIFGFPIEDYYRRVGFNFARDPYPLLAERYIQRYNEAVPHYAAMDHAAETLAQLQQRGYQQVILSACRRDYLIEQVAQRGLKGYFTELLGLSDIYGVSKVQTGLDYLHASGLDPADCVMVGDTDHDAEVAAAMGIQCILIAQGHQSRPRLETVCPVVLGDITELPRALEKL